MRWLVSVTAGVALMPVALAEQADGAESYAQCAACHLAEGAGVPGAFPPIRNRAAAIARLDGGREYLITVALHGLMGMLTVEGQVYAGVMVGHKGILDSAAIAAAINHTVFDLNDDPESASGVEAFTAAEVDSVDASLGQGGPMVAGQQRSALVAKYPEQWPQ